MTKATRQKRKKIMDFKTYVVENFKQDTVVQEILSRLQSLDAKYEELSS